MCDVVGREKETSAKGQQDTHVQKNVLAREINDENN
jgi:hypothetical protein